MGLFGGGSKKNTTNTNQYDNRILVEGAGQYVAGGYSDQSINVVTDGGAFAVANKALDTAEHGFEIVGRVNSDAMDLVESTGKAAFEFADSRAEATDDAYRRALGFAQTVQSEANTTATHALDKAFVQTPAGQMSDFTRNLIIALAVAVAAPIFSRAFK